MAVGHHGEPVIRAAGEVDRVDGPAGPAVDVPVRRGAEEVVVAEWAEERCEPVAEEGVGPLVGGGAPLPRRRWPASTAGLEGSRQACSWGRSKNAAGWRM